ncbi:MAG: hypothetical protein RMY16_05215 [Nostoc sp. DedQUE12b]|uniref:hypothetical protein n=1 Tax=Nostoc sp. DedQUE12b TaxID=3075398 RepID=UPI002AD3A8E5|nr:hypothetical protein [Nostoc sp. DedQUE12b]MDZ8084986.1 hypothetical protein [Nostoc sp. DedQUE12b]
MDLRFWIAIENPKSKIEGGRCCTRGDITAQVVEALCITCAELCKLLRSGRGNNCQLEI